MDNFKEIIGSEIGRAINEIFSTMILMDVSEVADSESNRIQIPSNISSLIGLGGDLRGLLSLHFPKSVATALTSSFLGMEVTDLDDDVKDATGELANMVAGNLKIVMAENDISAELAIPSTIIGDSYKTSGLGRADKVSAVFQTGKGKFCVDLRYQLNNK